MKSFLKQVAEYYSNTTNIEDYCFVFPNRRSGQFFERELGLCFKQTRLMPRITTLPELLGELTPKVVVDPIDAIFTLYQAYSDVFGEQASGIDHFIFWSHIILNDFNDVDMALADARSLFSNVSDLRNIATDYIDPSLKQDIKRIFDIDIISGDTFWKRSPHNDNDAQEQYFTLWEKLADIYHRFHRLLDMRNMTTQGMLYRYAALNAHNAKWRYSRIVMVGFAALTVSEERIFKAVKEMGGHFWWDTGCFKIFDNKANKGLNLIKVYAERYPSPQPVTEQNHAPHVSTFAVPSGVGQAKWAINMTKEIGRFAPIFNALSLLFYDNGNRETEEDNKKIMPATQLPIINLDNAINPAIVLPDDKLFIPIVNSIPAEMKLLNVTMGYPMRNAGIMTLMHLVARAHRQATKTGERWMYFRDTVLDILSHPMVKSAFTGQVLSIRQAIDASNDFNVSEDLFKGTVLEHLFTTINDTADHRQVILYIDRLISFAKILDEHTRIAHNATLTDADDPDLLPLQSAFTMHFISALTQLKQVFMRSTHAPATDTSIFYLIDRAVSSTTIPFTGEPLQGMQVMGMLETRSLDFDNIIVLSMNERVFPTRRAMSSFIPDMIRNIFSLPTNAINEATTTYHFYRLLARTNHAMLIYDSSAQSYGSGEPSRYISQLDKIYNLPITRVNINSNVVPSNALTIEVKKAPEMVNRYVEKSDEQKFLSASAINGYIDCPMRFYFQRIEGFNNDNEATEFMDAAMLGTIVHNTLQEFYYPKDKALKGPRKVTIEMIDDFKKNALEATVIRHINKEYLHRPDDKLNKPLSGDAYILQETINTFVTNALNYDKHLIEQHGPIEVIECEEPHKIDLDIDGSTIHFNFTIDRLDRVGNTLRIVDYKTGKDATSFSDINSLFNSKNGKKRPHAILQLLLYCNAWNVIDPQATEIVPIIYKLAKMEETGVKYAAGRNDNRQYVYRKDDPINVEFLKTLKETIDNLLSLDEPFKQTEHDTNCQYCRFTEFCRR